MKTFTEFLESIVDPKRDPGVGSIERQSLSSPEDDDYVPPEEQDDFWSDDDEKPVHRGELGVTAQYPLAHASGKMRGLQTQSPEELFRTSQKSGDAIRDKLSGQDLVDTLKSKLYAKEPMSSREIDYLIKMLNKEYDSA